MVRGLSLKPNPSGRGAGLSALWIPILLLAAALAMPAGATHTVTERTCSGDYPSVFPLAGPSCSTASIPCPASHGGFCSFKATVTVTGTGIVGAAVHGAAATCAPSLGSCYAELIYNVSPGLSSSTNCQVGTASVALNVHLACKLRG